MLHWSVTEYAAINGTELNSFLTGRRKESVGKRESAE